MNIRFCVIIIFVLAFSVQSVGASSILGDDFLDNVKKITEREKEPIKRNFTIQGGLPDSSEVELEEAVFDETNKREPSKQLLKDYATFVQSIRADESGKLLIDTFGSDTFGGAQELCSYAVRVFLQAVTGLGTTIGVDKDHTGIWQGDAITLIESGIQEDVFYALDKGFEDITGHAHHLFESYGSTVFDIFILRDSLKYSGYNQGHRFVLFLADNDLWYVLDPSVYPYKGTPILLEDYLRHSELGAGEWMVSGRGFQVANFLKIHNTEEVEGDSLSRETQGDRYARINESRFGYLSLRAGNRLSSDLLDHIPAGEEVVILQEDVTGRWYFVEYNGQEGWISSKYTTPVFVYDKDLYITDQEHAAATTKTEQELEEQGTLFEKVFEHNGFLIVSDTVEVSLQTVIDDVRTVLGLTLYDI